MAALAGGILAATSMAFADSSVVSNHNSAQPQAHRVDKSELSKVAAPRHTTYAKKLMGASYWSDMGASIAAQGPKGKSAGTTPAVADAVFCGICDSNSVAAGEPVLSFPTTAYGSPPLAAGTTSMDPFVAVNQLKDQGCFSIIACINGITLPATLPAPNSTPNWKVCGTCGNFDGQNDTSASKSLFTALNAGGTDALHVTPVVSGCPGSPTLFTNQRDQDYILIHVPSGGWNDFRITYTAAFPYDCDLICNKNFPDPGTIASCANGNDVVPDEFGFVPIINGEEWISNPNNGGVAPDSGGEGDKNTSLAFPRTGTAGNLPEGDYIATIRLAASTEVRWTAQGGPFAKNTPWQIQIQGSAGNGGLTGGVGACCNTTSGACSALSESDCSTAGNQYRGEGTLCASLDTPCVFACSGTNELSFACDTADNDPNIGCSSSSGTFNFQNLSIPAGGGSVTLCGKFGIFDDVNAAAQANDVDWYTLSPALNGTQAVEKKLVMTLESDGAAQLFFIYDIDQANTCTDIYGVGFTSSFAGKLSVEVCVPPNTKVYALVAGNSSANCTDATGNRYKLIATVTNSACTAGACCSAAGACTSVTGTACYTAGGVFFGEAVLCSAVTCCGATVCDAGAVAENEPTANCYTVANELSAPDDTYNSGCKLDIDGSTPIGSGTFTTAAPNSTVCGTGSMGRNALDEDWYQIQLTTTNYLGVIAKSSYDMDLVLYKGSSDGCPGDGEAALTALAFGSETASACDGTDVIGDCLDAGLYWVVVRPNFANTYGVPCGSKYNLQFFVGLCGGSITCDSGATSEGESNCETTFDGGCNNTTVAPSFVTVSCNQKICGTYDAVVGIRDTDWYSFTGSGSVTITLKGEGYSQLGVYKKGTASNAGCDDATFVNGLNLINPNVTATLNLTGLASGTYYIVVSPDFDGPTRVCCGAKYQLNVSCTPACGCSANIVDPAGGPNCVVNTVDLGALLANFGKSCPANGACPILGDINGDHTVNTVDLGTLLAQFGKNGSTGTCQ